jgi:hypothetical protein
MNLIEEPYLMMEQIINNLIIATMSSVAMSAIKTMQEIEESHAKAKVFNEYLKHYNEGFELFKAVKSP